MPSGPRLRRVTAWRRGRVGPPPVVYTAHGLAYRKDAGRTGRQVSLWAERAACRGADAVTSVSRADLADLQGRGFLGDRPGFHVANAVQLPSNAGGPVGGAAPPRAAGRGVGGRHRLAAGAAEGGGRSDRRGGADRARLRGPGGATDSRRGRRRAVAREPRAARARGRQRRAGDDDGRPGRRAAAPARVRPLRSPRPAGRASRSPSSRGWRRGSPAWRRPPRARARFSATTRRAGGSCRSATFRRWATRSRVCCAMRARGRRWGRRRVRAYGLAPRTRRPAAWRRSIVDSWPSGHVRTVTEITLPRAPRRNRSEPAASRDVVGKAMSDRCPWPLSGDGERACTRARGERCLPSPVVVHVRERHAGAGERPPWRTSTA